MDRCAKQVLMVLTQLEVTALVVAVVVGAGIVVAAELAVVVLVVWIAF